MSSTYHGACESRFVRRNALCTTEPNINHRETVFGGSASSLTILAVWSAKPSTAKLTIIIAIVGAVIYVFFRSLCNTFPDFIHASHEYAADAALLFSIAIYLVSKVIIIRKRKKDKEMLKKPNY
jgi:Putative thioesterase (yiiD_Cterm)